MIRKIWHCLNFDFYEIVGPAILVTLLWKWFQYGGIELGLAFVVVELVRSRRY